MNTDPTPVAAAASACTAAEAGAVPPPPPPPAPARRRLWQLQGDLRAALVGLGLPGAQLRRQAERALGRLHQRPVQLMGSDAEVLASVLHDLGTRNAISEALHDALAARHAATVARLAAVRDLGALQAVWRTALKDSEAPATAWALLTHPLGRDLDDAVLVDLRHWACTRARTPHGQAEADAALARALLHARAEADTLRLRLQHEQAAWARENDARAREFARLRGELARLRAELGAPSRPPCGAAASPEAPKSPVRPAGASLPPSRPGRPARRTVPILAAGPTMPPGPPASEAAQRQPTPPLLQGRRVLCVGGMPGAQDRYRRLVETAGAEFDFHDGGLEQGLHRLDRQLGAADLVVCQAGCLNHEAYRRVKGHCRRADKACLFVERPSLAHFARTLGLAAGEGA